MMGGFSGRLKLLQGMMFFLGIFLEGEDRYFSRSLDLRFSQGIKIIPSELSFLSGCSRFSRG